MFHFWNHSSISEWTLGVEYVSLSLQTQTFLIGVVEPDYQCFITGDHNSTQQSLALLLCVTQLWLLIYYQKWSVLQWLWWLANYWELSVPCKQLIPIQVTNFWPFEGEYHSIGHVVNSLLLLLKFIKWFPQCWCLSSCLHNGDVYQVVSMMLMFVKLSPQCYCLSSCLHDANVRQVVSTMLMFIKLSPQC